jgi:hypothetical protein
MVNVDMVQETVVKACKVGTVAHEVILKTILARLPAVTDLIE